MYGMYVVMYVFTYMCCGGGQGGGDNDHNIVDLARNVFVSILTLLNALPPETGSH